MLISILLVLELHNTVSQNSNPHIHSLDLLLKFFNRVLDLNNRWRICNDCPTLIYFDLHFFEAFKNHPQFVLKISFLLSLHVVLILCDSFILCLILILNSLKNKKTILETNFLTHSFIDSSFSFADLFQNISKIISLLLDCWLDGWHQLFNIREILFRFLYVVSPLFALAIFPDFKSSKCHFTFNFPVFLLNFSVHNFPCEFVLIIPLNYNHKIIVYSFPISSPMSNPSESSLSSLSPPITSSRIPSPSFLSSSS